MVCGNEANANANAIQPQNLTKKFNEINVPNTLIQAEKQNGQVSETSSQKQAVVLSNNFY